MPGEAAILVRYMGHVTVCRVTVPRAGVTFPRPPEANVIDKHVWDKLGSLSEMESAREASRIGVVLTPAWVTDTLRSWALDGRRSTRRLERRPEKRRPF